jgi:WD40 repeat protein
VGTQSLLHGLTAEATAYFSADFSPNGSILAVGDASGRITLFDTESGSVVQIIAAHSDLVAGLAFSPDGSRLASGSYDSTIRVWAIS